MTVESFPSRPGFIDRQWGYMANTSVFESPITKAVESYGLTGTRWMGAWTLPRIIDPDLLADWEVFFAKLQGRQGRFWGKPPRPNTRGAGAGSPKVNGAGQTGKSIITDGWTGSQLQLKKGDYIRFNTTNIVVIVTADFTSSGGAGTISFEPSLRTSPADNEDIVVNDVGVRMMLVGDEVGWDVNKAGDQEFRLQGVEVWT